MSCGLVICSICKRELNQGGSKTVEKGWRHNDDNLPRCEGAEARYPDPTEPSDLGRFRCEEWVEGLGRCPRIAVKLGETFRVMGGPIWTCGEEHKRVRAPMPPTPGSNRSERRRIAAEIAREAKQRGTRKA